ncbi:hypothetical protein EIN_469420 [Entamoeba invadens IP1]|uniref:Uncharacterized protein n=1 Tax=Entamoeba invadens IP1 TaxID=370355 RepID=A0A0A1TWL0_ENTIV|nr:hypothetical protein EIN_469420 [Entamoeba invadens IP1]ELP83738.1 hypothetical protein EIN_469420 [Entamoeba invadens IP1]|eukprot:XP_004183084.1 hypothetical protein EIN_469420 [Entamoeba invadens IP1]
MTCNVVFLFILSCYADDYLFRAKLNPITPATQLVAVPQRVRYPVKVCGMLNCFKREIINTNCNFVGSRGRFSCYNIEENKCTALPSKKFCYRLSNVNMTYVYVNKTGSDPNKYTLYTFKDAMCTTPDKYDKPFTAVCSSNNLITGKFACEGEKSPLGMLCKARDTFYNNTKKSVIKSGDVRNVVCIALILIALIL